MADTEFQRLQDFENRKTMTQSVEGLLIQVKKLTELMEKTAKEVRAVREDLRNAGKLRPLRKKDEEEEEKVEQPVEGQQEIPQNPSDTQQV